MEFLEGVAEEARGNRIELLEGVAEDVEGLEGSMGKGIAKSRRFVGDLEGERE